MSFNARAERALAVPAGARAEIRERLWFVQREEVTLKRRCFR